MKHVLLTRYAMRFAEDNPRRRYEDRSSWLDYRLKLFHRYTLPSVQAQTFKDFDWWLLLDPTFPGILEHEPFLQKHAKICWLGADWKEAQVEVGEVLSEQYKNEWVCSTRLDSDDVISTNFMRNLHDTAEETESWISFPNGYMMKNNSVVNRTYLVNPFVSYVEYADPFKSVFSICHTKVDKQEAPLLINSERSWIQVDHNDNIKNLVSKKIGNFEDKCYSANAVRNKFTWDDK